jgi:RING finger/CHY zinc finger protein 1
MEFNKNGPGPLDKAENVEENSQIVDKKIPSKYHCAHYRRKCKFVTPCCNRVYRCRFCHDEEQPNHTLKREDVTVVECSECGERQTVRESCVKCEIKFGQYFCHECKLYDDEEKDQFHCEGCGICRVGGRANYFHCHRCDMCLPNHLQGAHKCVEKVSRSNCPVCQEDIHTSRIPSQIPPCNHLIHKNCFDEMLSNGHYACPTCGASMIPMSDIWKMYDKEIEETPLPENMVNLFVNISCKDCTKSTLTPFHILGNKCADCGSYNTVQEKGGYLRVEPNGSMTPANLLPPVERDQEQDMDQDEETDHEENYVDGIEEGIDAVAELNDLTPPDTPVRDEALSDRTSLSLGLRRIRTPEQHLVPSVLSYVPLTPEYSNHGDLPREPVLFRRRISFSEDSGESRSSDSSVPSSSSGVQNPDTSPET